MVGAGSNLSSGGRSALRRSFSASNLPADAQRKAPVEGAGLFGEAAERGDGDEEMHPKLDVEDPRVVESYTRLQEEQAAKLEAWLGDSKEDEAIQKS